MGSSIWSNDRDKKIYDEVENRIDNYFNDLYEQTNGIEVVTDSGLNYREGQHNFALEVMKAIRENKLLLIQAGVGIGKSYGYLIPIFYNFDGTTKLNKIVISTSSIALQYQLLSDIDKISEMLGIKMQAVIAKGINNYACEEKIAYYLNNKALPLEKKAIIREISKNISEARSCDKADLRKISEEIWKYVQLSNRGRCSNCSYSRHCSFYKTQEKIKASDIIITNHANYINDLLNDGIVTQDVDMVVFDEAHKIEDNIININQGEIRLSQLFWRFDVMYKLLMSESGDDDRSLIVINELRKELKDIEGRFKYLFHSIKRSAQSIFNKDNRANNAITDGDRLSFNLNKNIVEEVRIAKDRVMILLNRLIEVKDSFDVIDDRKLLYKINNYIKELEELLSILSDMELADKSENIYWVSFYDEEYVDLGYVKKNNLDITKKMFGGKIPIVCTSATMKDSYDSYGHFMESLNLDKIGNRAMEMGEAQKSPFDYDNNSLFYYDLSVAKPRQYDEYKCDLALRISELIRVTEGKALVLFTSKKCMNDVYDLIKNEEFPFKIMIQSDKNTEALKKEFSEDTNSCLFATGAFWEGIDIKGKSLSNLIVTHLPFDIVDAVSKYEASKYVEWQDKFNEVYIPNMLIKLEQAIGRLIRDYDDTGIVCCLDSRIGNYLNDIKVVSSIKNFTTDINDVIRFSDEKITNDKTDEQVKKLMLQ